MTIRSAHAIFAGPVVELEGDVVRKLQFGDPTLGWEGDPALQLAYNRQDDRIELWRRINDTQSLLVLRSKPGQRLVDMNLIKFLVTHDHRRGHNAAREVEEHNARLQARRDKDFEEQMVELNKKLRWAIEKDIG